jgi:flagellum-specific ATP synthase
MADHLTSILNLIDSVPLYIISGKVVAVKGLMVEAVGLEKFVSIGSKCKIITRNNKDIVVEVVGFRENTILLMPFSELEAVGIGCRVEFTGSSSVIYPDESWLGRIINGDAEAIDDKGYLAAGSIAYPLKNTPPSSHKRQRVGKKIDLGIKALNSFINCCYGQRMGIFSGSGVGKSVLISMLTKFSDNEIKIVGLIGERGREVQEFLHEYLDEEALKTTIVVVATSDESALMRRQAAYLTMALAEYFRDQGKNVLCIMDNITRFAMAQREIGLSAGEPPSNKGYTPTVFSELPKLLERAGPGAKNSGSITAFFAVLVEGDDHNEPIADAVRGIIDGHIVLERAIAERGRFPAINILKSVSRTMPFCNSDEENELISRARNILATYEDMAEMIRLGAYKIGTDVEIDKAIKYYPHLDRFLAQKPKEFVTMQEAYIQLAEILNI